MSISLYLDQDYSTSGGKSHDFEIQFQPALSLKDSYDEEGNVKAKWEIALVRADLWYTFHSISSVFGNHTLDYFNGSTTENVVYPNGQYPSVEKIEQELHKQMKANGDYTIVSGVDTFAINIKPNYITFKVEITITGAYTLDLSGSSFFELLGFSAAQVASPLAAGVHVSDNIGDVTRGVNSLQINCSAVEESYLGGSESRVLYAFVPQSAPGSSIEVEPTQKVYSPVVTSNGLLRSMRIFLTDQQGRPVDINKEKMTVRCHLRKRKVL